MASTVDKLLETRKEGLFPAAYSWPPFWSIQPTLATRQDQFREWSSIILAYCREYGIWRLNLVDALNTPLFHNAQLRKRMNLLEAREILDWMTRDVGGQRAEWIGKEGEKSIAWIYWRRPEEWAEVISSWVSHVQIRRGRQNYFRPCLTSCRLMKLGRKILYSPSMNYPKGRPQYLKVSYRQGT